VYLADVIRLSSERFFVSFDTRTTAQIRLIEERNHLKGVAA